VRTREGIVRAVACARCSWSQKYQARDSAKCRAVLYFCSARENGASAGGVYSARGKKAVIIARRYFSATAGDALICGISDPLTDHVQVILRPKGHEGTTSKWYLEKTR
jgi:hypothetical protein